MPLPFRRIYNPTIQKGSIINFQYLFHSHDPQPLVLVTSIYSDGRIAGINLHYLTYQYVKNLVKNFCDNRSFGYQRIKGDRFLYKSFRTYKKFGIKNLHMLDCASLNQLLGTVRSFNFKPGELQAMQDSIRQQMQNINKPPAQNPSAQDMTGKMQGMLTPQQHNMFNMDKRVAPNLAEPDDI